MVYETQIDPWGYKSTIFSNLLLEVIPNKTNCIRWLRKMREWYNTEVPKDGSLYIEYTDGSAIYLTEGEKIVMAKASQIVALDYLDGDTEIVFNLPIGYNPFLENFTMSEEYGEPITAELINKLKLADKLAEMEKEG